MKAGVAVQRMPTESTKAAAAATAGVITSLPAVSAPTCGASDRSADSCVRATAV
jgi:hypothetical protein